MNYNGIKISYYGVACFDGAQVARRLSYSFAEVRKAIRRLGDSYKIWADYGYDPRMDSAYGDCFLVEYGDSRKVYARCTAAKVKSQMNARRKCTEKRGAFGETYRVAVEW